LESLPKKLSKELRRFFTFCVENEWLAENPVKAIKAPQVKVASRVPFSDEQVNQILSKAEDDREPHQFPRGNRQDTREARA
jgi:site-specific recombinase XerC